MSPSPRCDHIVEREVKSRRKASQSTFFRKEEKKSAHRETRTLKNLLMERERINFDMQKEAKREREKESEEGVRDTTKMKRIKKTARKELFEQWKQNMD